MKPVLAIAIISCGLLVESCIVQQPQGQQQPSQPQPPNQETYYYQYQNWSGPGWYYGVYFSDEGRYRRWYRDHRSHYHRRQHGHHGHHGGHRGRGGHHGGRH